MSSKEELYRAMLETAPYGTLFFVYGVCIDCNPKALAVFNCEKNQLVGSSLDEISGDETPAFLEFKLRIKQAIKSNQTKIRWSMPGVDGPKTSLLLNLQRVGHGDKEYIITLLEDSITTLAPQVENGDHVIDEADRQDPKEEHAAPAMSEHVPRADQQPPPRSDRRSTAKPDLMVFAPVEATPITRQQRKFDGLTRLPNRVFLAERLSEYFSQNSSGELCGAMLMIDLDHFKDINDSWGHGVGDQVIKKLGLTIARCVSGENLLARIGGDEFVLFIPVISESIANAELNAQELAERVREMIAKPMFLDGHELSLTASIGIALLAETGLTPERAMQHADSAMYEAKRKGRNGIAFFDPGITEKAKRQIGLNTRLRKALDNQEFALYIQPQISVETGKLLGGEALLRWINPEKICNMPAEFIPVLESSGLIVNVGHWVIRTACEYIRSFIDEGLWRDHMELSINISPRQFVDKQLLDVVRHSLESYDIDPKYLNFEITENLLIDNVEDVIRKMNDIKSLGSKFSIDDFGIGYSSMAYLKRLPFDTLKIDREFIRNINCDVESRGVVEAIMAVSRQYGLDVVAEGVENIESLDILRDVGCHTYQGAHYSMPIPVDRFKRMLVA